MVRIGGGSTKFVLSDRWIVYTKRRKQLLHRKYLLYETGCSKTIAKLYSNNLLKRIDTYICQLHQESSIELTK